MNVSRDLAHQREPPAQGRRFYAIEQQDDGTVDVYLAPVVCVYDTDLGVREYAIRARYEAWCESGEEIDLCP